jgi:hypothetical protein
VKQILLCPSLPCKIYNNFDFYEDQLKLQGMNIGIKWFMVTNGLQALPVMAKLRA